MLDRFRHHRPMISGVCAWMADQSGVPVWIIRLVAVLVALGHLPLAVLGYFGGAYALRRRQSAGGLPAEADRFAYYDRRMAEAEDAAWREELRRRR
jgi:phage shock protein PspC (stress-responsive transcriptional regulator)